MLRSTAMPMIQRKEFRRRLPTAIAFAAIGPDHLVLQFLPAPTIRGSALFRMKTLVFQAPCVPARAARGLKSLTRG
jgi:hypothetical protein